LHARTFGLAVPGTTAPGTYYLLGKVDHASAVSESNETNNGKVGSLITVTANFALSKPVVASTAKNG
jgi:subtilase family serine protease